MSGFQQNSTLSKATGTAKSHPKSINPHKISELEETLLCPKFVVKKVVSTQYHGAMLRLYFNKDDLFKNLQIYLESPNDILIQPFIRQSHVTRPQLLRYYMKNDQSVYKAQAIANSYEMSRREKIMQNIYTEIQVRYKQLVQMSLLRHQKRTFRARAKKASRAEGAKGDGSGTGKVDRVVRECKRNNSTEVVVG